MRTMSVRQGFWTIDPDYGTKILVPSNKGRDFHISVSDRLSDGEWYDYAIIISDPEGVMGINEDMWEVKELPKQFQDLIEDAFARADMRAAVERINPGDNG